MSTTAQPVNVTSVNSGWATLAAQLQQNYFSAKTNAENIVVAAAENESLKFAATQAAIAELNAAKSYNDFLNTGAQLHKLSSDIYTQLKTNPNLSMSQQLQLSAEQKRLDAAFVEFESFKNDAALKYVHVPPVYADGQIYSVDGSLQRDPNTLMGQFSGLVGQIGGFVGTAITGLSGLIQAATLSNENQYTACVGLLDTLTGAFVGKLLSAPGQFNRYQGAAWDELTGNAFQGSPAGDTCRLVYPADGVPSWIRQLGAVSDGFNETLGALTAIDIDPALLAGIGLADALSLSVSQGVMDASQAQELLNAATGSSEFSLARLPQLPKYAYQTAAALPLEVDGAIWNEAGLMGGIFWVPPTVVVDVAPPSPYSFTSYLNSAGAGLSADQQRGLALQLDGLQLGGEGALSFVTLPGGNTTLIQNADGDIVGEINQSADGSMGYARLNGVRINADGSTEPYIAYVAPNGQALTPEQYSDAQVREAAGALGLINTLIGLQNWNQQSDLSHASTLVAIYNQINNLSGGVLGGSTGLGSLGALGAGLGLLSALESGNAGGIIVNSIGLGDVLWLNEAGKGAVSAAIAEALGLSVDAANGVVPGLGFLIALDSGDPISIASSGLSLLSSLGYIGPWGAVAGVVLSLLGSLFEDDIPMKEGQAQANWDSAGNVYVSTTQDVEGGGPTATGWMNSLVQGMQQQLAGLVDSEGQPVYGLIPQRLPSVGYQYDPDGMNYAAVGHLYLKWFDANGVEQTRYYDGAGNRGDGTGETFVGDFMKYSAAAFVPTWEAQTVLAHWQETLQTQGLEAANAQARQAAATGLPQEAADHLTQTLSVLTFELPSALPLTGTLTIRHQGLIDIDGDGYLERTEWVNANQALLAIDLNGDGIIGAGELLNMDGAGTARNTLSWLDANHDGRLDASDPAFHAIRIWLDVNQDGQSQASELRSLSAAAIVAIDFSSLPPSLVRADGSSIPLTQQHLTGDVLGVAYAATVGGLLEAKEAGETVLHALNTRAFDGQADHTHGGDLDIDGAEGMTVAVNAAGSYLVSTTANTIGTQSTQTSTVLAEGDARIQQGTTGQADSGQVAGQTQGTPGAAQVRSNGVVFVPAAATSPAAQIREATAAMVRSAEGGLFGTDSAVIPLVALAVGAAAAQWPTVVSAAPLPEDAATLTLPSGAASEPINWPIWETSPVSAAAQGASTPSQAGTNSPTTTSSSTPNGSTSGGNSDASNQTPAPTVQAQALLSSVAGSVSYVSSPTPAPASGEATNNGPANWPTSAASEVSGAMVIDYPNVKGGQAGGEEDTVLRFLESLLLVNDSTLNAPAWPDQPSLRITSVFAPVHGSVSLQANAQGALEVVFVPEANYHGPASFSYTVSDQYGLSSNASVTLQLTPVNDAPVAVGESAVGDEDTTLLFTAASLLANDSDVDTAVDGDVLRITRVGLAEHGQVFLQPDGTVRFEPDANYNGPARFTYWVGDRDPAQIAAGEGYETPATVLLTVLAVNDLPVVTGEVMDSDEDVVLNIDPALLLANDTDVDIATNGQVLFISAVGDAQHGSIELLPDGMLRFTPERDYFGVAGFSYTVDDGNGGQVVGQVVINLAPVNDAPVVVGETISFDEDEIQTITQAQLLANDFDVDNPHADLRIVAVDNATHGTVALNPNGSIRFVPEADYFGAASFTYTVSDGAGGFTVGTASLDIAPVNDAPRLVGESATLDEDTQARFSMEALLANDTDVDNPHSDLTIIAAGDATHGSVQIIAGEIVFTPHLNFYGQASFTYTVSDGAGGSSKATVSLVFNPVNDAPVANGELFWGKRNVSYTLSQAALLANDTDVETPNALRVSAISNVQHGTAVLHADGSVSFTPEAGYAGRGSFDYVVQDPEGATGTATAEIDFSRINVNPVAVDDSFIGFEDTAFIIQQSQLLANDSDPDASGLTTMTVDAVRNAVNGTVRIQADGSVRFDPALDFYGTATFEYRANDGEGGQTWAKVYLNVQSVNDAPIIEDIWYGKPIYGYTYYTDINNGGVYFGVVMNETEARALAARGLLASEAGLVITPTYYRNGQMRPFSFDANDSYVDTGPEGGVFITDDLYRQYGRVIAYDPDGDSSAITLSIASGPQHGHAWANVYFPDAAPFANHTTAPGYFVGQAGAWQYFSHYGDPYFGADPFMIRVTDGEGASTTAMIAASHQGSSAGGGGKCPIVMDLNGDGIQLIRPEDSNIFADVNGDGWRERIGWAGNDDGVLVFDANGDGRITDNAEISFVGYKEGARTDLDGLAAFDTNGDGKLTAEDESWSKFGVFRDANGNGRHDDGEFMTLEQLGITAIGLQRQGTPYMDNGNVVFGTAVIEFADGRTGVAGDVMFAGQNVPLPQAVLDVLEQAEVARLALLMSQYGALAQAQEAEPLGHVNWAEVSQAQVAAADMASALVQTEHFGAPAASGVSA